MSHSGCWNTEPWMAQDLWRSAVPQGEAYWTAITKKVPVLMIDQVIIPIPYPGCGDDCSCVGTQLTAVLMPRVWWTSSCFPMGPWPYGTDLCGPYALLADSEDEWNDGDPDKMPFPGPGPYGDVVPVPDETGWVFYRTMRPIWDMVPVPHAGAHTEHATDPLTRLWWSVLRNEEQFWLRVQSTFEEITDSDDVFAAAAWIEEYENDFQPLTQQVAQLLQVQRDDWTSLLIQVGDECSSSQLLQPQQQGLAYSR